MFEEILVEKLVDESNSWDRVRQENEIPAKMLAFCWRRYDSTRPEELFQNTRVVLGTLLHRGLEKYFGYEDKPTNVLKKKVGDYVIVGMPDLILGDTVYEFKYSTRSPKKAREWDIRQVRTYLWITGKPKGEIVYFTPWKIDSFEVTEPATDEEILEWIGHKWAKYEWECNYCPFKDECEHSLIKANNDPKQSTIPDSTDIEIKKIGED